ncbi:MAG: methyl-accepting chemotaxis protein [Hydrogenophilus sp.]|nr:methyl-accepting chemotaxis protein [Hydrogenophilus sp.]
MSWRFGDWKIWVKLAAAIWVVLAVAWTGMTAWEAYATRQTAIAQAKSFALSMHETTLAALTAMMFTGTIEQRDLFLDQIRELSAIRDLKVLRGTATVAQFGPGHAGETAADPVEEQVLTSGREVVQVERDAQGEFLRAVRPAVARKRYLGKDCTMCHTVPEGTVLGAVSMKIRLDEVNAAVWRRFTESYATALAVSGVVMLVIFMAMRRLLNRPLERVIEHLDAIAAGDLTRPMSVVYRDEIGHLRLSLAKMRENLIEVLREIEDSSRSMVQSSFHVATISSEIAQVGRRQEAKSGEVNTAMEQLHQIATEVEASATAAVERAQRVETLAREGREQVQRNVAAMGETVAEVAKTSEEIGRLTEAAREIGSIVAVIQEIARQTNLLALNAAIEAARAGEVGRGFAVVADEVRKLSERTSHSADEVNRIISSLVERIEGAVALMTRMAEGVERTEEIARATGEVIAAMAGEVDQMAAASRSIAAVSRDQMRQFATLSETLRNLFAILGENSSKVEASALVADDLRAIAERLKAMMERFVFPHKELSAESQHDKRRFPRSRHSLEVRVQQGTMESMALTADFSLGGMQLRMARCPFDRSRPVTLAILLPQDELEGFLHQKPVECRARIVWVREEGERCLMGVEFLDPTEHERAAIQRCYAYYRERVAV